MSNLNKSYMSKLNKYKSDIKLYHKHHAVAQSKRVYKQYKLEGGKMSFRSITKNVKRVLDK